MAVKKLPAIASKKGKVSEEEWEARLELAAAYRLAAHFGWTHLIYNHISLRVPGTKDHFLLNPFGLLYEQVTASSLVKIDCEGHILEDSPFGVNRAGFVIHSAIHMARPDLHCVMHTHSEAGQAVSALECGILPLNQDALRFYGHTAFHGFEGIAFDTGERDRLVADLGHHKIMVLKNHGLMTAGVDTGEAFSLMYFLEKTCTTQMQVLASNKAYSLPPPEMCEHTARQMWGNGDRVFGTKEWPALMALADEMYPGYAS